MPVCLVVEDDPAQATILSDTVALLGIQALRAAEGRAALALASEERPDIVVLDLGLPDCNGLDLIPELLKLNPTARVIVLTGQDSVATAVEALRLGARDYLLKPWELERLLTVLQREIVAVPSSGETTETGERETIFWGSHPEMVRIREEVDHLTRAPVTGVLILGETGTGKEVLARRIHEVTSPGGDFVTLNCAAIPTELLESELFGHEKGAFTGATNRRRGLAELARHGTLFLDEIGEMPVSLQPKLLRFLQDRSFRRVGGEEEIFSPCRVIAATHQDLEERCRQGAFRLDLYYRLAVVSFTIPPLRERREDLLPLTHLIIEKIAAELGLPHKQLSPAAEAAIVGHSWPGNIRELRNRLERALVLGKERSIQLGDLQLAAQPKPSEGSEILAALEAEGWNVTRAARRLGLARHQLRYRMRRLGIVRPSRS
ncbi:MAG TPA: sigma-54-dependent Fis family transcriptional regulator [Acidobacteria bacterium]|nr:sigma-54-dependent Fis family transcriptional regulator [Acidobacteriota bacterium]